LRFGDETSPPAVVGGKICLMVLPLLLNDRQEAPSGRLAWSIGLHCETRLEPDQHAGGGLKDQPNSRRLGINRRLAAL